MKDRSLDEFLDAPDTDESDGEAPGTEGESGGADDVAGEAVDDADDGVEGADGAGDAVDTSDDAGDAMDDAGDGEGDETAATGQADESTEGPAIEPAESTYVSRPGGGVCAACGESVVRRWEGDDGLVCPACKQW